MRNDRLDNYVYTYLDPRKPGRWEYSYEGQIKIFEYRPFYVGRGINNRIKVHLQIQSRAEFNIKNNILDKIYKQSLEPISFKIFDDLSFDESEIIEVDVIRKFGRIDLKTGILSNLTDGGEGSWRYIPSESTREKRKKSVSESSFVRRTKCVDQFDLEDNFIRTWNSAKEAAKSLNCDETSITMCCTGKLKTSFKFIWRYNGQIHDANTPVQKKARKVILRPIFQYLDGNFVKRFENILEYVKEIGCSKQSVWNACSGKTRFSQEYQLFYDYQGEIIEKVPRRDPEKEDYRLLTLRKGIDMFSKDRTFVKTFTSIAQLCSENKINHKTLAKKIKTGELYKGFIYEYAQSK